jgi:hypothetical protein
MAPKAMKAMKASGAAAAADGGLPYHESGLRGAGFYTNAGGGEPARQQTPGTTRNYEPMPRSPSTVHDDILYNYFDHGNGMPIDFKETFLTTTEPFTLRRGGGPHKGGKAKQAAQPKPPTKPQQSPTKTAPMPSPGARGTAAAPKPSQPKAQQTPLEEAELLEEHWSVPACKAEALHADQDGVALASKATYLAKKPILEGSAKRIAMLIPPSVDTEVDAPLVTIFANIDNETKQFTRKFIQLGSVPVQYTPPTTRGPALHIETMRTVVLVIVRNSCDDKQWKDHAAKCDELFLAFAKPLLAGTRWVDARPTRARPTIYEGKTTSMQAFMRVPEGKVDAFWKKSGMGDDMVFTRVFTERGSETPRIHTNIWIDKCTLEEARKKVRALPEKDAYGLIANHRGLAARVLETDAPRLAPLLNGRSYSTGDR